MPKAEWGKKVVCTNCGSKFYNLNRKPATCPSCGTEYIDLSNDIMTSNAKQVFNENVDVVTDNNLVGSNAAESIAGDEELNIDDAMDDETISLEETDSEVDVIENEVDTLELEETNPSDLDEE